MTTKYKHLIIGLLILINSLSLEIFADTNSSQASIGVIPQPSSIIEKKGSFIFDKNTTVVVENREQAKIAEILAIRFETVGGFSPKIIIGNGNGNVTFKTKSDIPADGYNLNVTSKRIVIEASGNEGFFYGIQSLRQLLPSSIESSGLACNPKFTVPAVEIKDTPRFNYRGLMLDVSRYFIPKEEVLKIIDCAAMLKVNKLHLHLVDDNGWRIEIKKYPLLTDVGAWRVKRDEEFPARLNARPNERALEGGFYTQDDMREIVARAAKNYIEVIPEIEMPAHTNASLAAYPHFACPVVKKPIVVLSGAGGKNSEIIYCAGNDSVFSFLEDVIDEIVEIFPSKYIHLGGDEATKTNWEVCDKCKKRMVQENLTDTEELQAYFMNRMGDYVRSKGKQPMGWDELINGKLPKDIVIFGWQQYGTAAIKAAEQGHKFVMTPAKVMYLIRYQGPQWFEPRTYFGNLTLKDMYDYEPFQSNWSESVKSLLLGIQASLWTEFCNTPEDVEYLIFPRLAALSETAWSKKENKNWTEFVKNVDNLTHRWDEMGIIYARSMFNLDHKVMPDNNKLKVGISCIRPDVDIRYTIDGSKPTVSSNKYIDTLLIENPCIINACTFRNGMQEGEILTLKLEFNKATGKKVTTNDNSNTGYLLTNGLYGSDKHTDFEWCGWYNTAAIINIDLENTTDINSIKIGSINNYGMAVHQPSSIEILVSDDNINFKQLVKKTYTEDEIFYEGISTKNIIFNNLNASGRYVRIKADNPGVCPSLHVKGGHPTWMHFDEISIE